MKTRSTKALLKHYVSAFNQKDDENIIQAIPNTQAEEWLEAQIPRVCLPEPMLEQTYYFRWWVYRKHIKQTPDGMVVTEFHPNVPWAGKHNTIIASACHHVDEGRWLCNTSFLNEYITFLYRGGASIRAYSNWLEHAVAGFCRVLGDTSLGEKLLDDMVQNHMGWDATNLHSSGLYWSIDSKDASEFSVSGTGLRPTLNCYQYANEMAIAEFSRRKGNHSQAEHFYILAQSLKERINQMLWNEQDAFYKVLPLTNRTDTLQMEEPDTRRNVREIWGFLPWTFELAPQGRAVAFEQLLQVNGFGAAYGLTTAERRHPGFGIFYTGEELNSWLESRGEKTIGAKGHECLWNGPSWPFSTCLTLKALSNLLVSGETQDTVNATDYVRLLVQYARSHIRLHESGVFIPWLDENINPDTGDWISRTRLSQWDDKGWSSEKGGYERGKDYNHSTFCDLVISGLFGVRPDFERISVEPLFPAEWPYATLENLRVHQRRLDILYQNPKLGGTGYRVLVDDECVHQSNLPQSIVISD